MLVSYASSAQKWPMLQQSIILKFSKSAISRLRLYSISLYSTVWYNIFIMLYILTVWGGDAPGLKALARNLEWWPLLGLCRSGAKTRVKAYVDPCQICWTTPCVFQIWFWGRQHRLLSWQPGPQWRSQLKGPVPGAVGERPCPPHCQPRGRVLLGLLSSVGAVSEGTVTERLQAVYRPNTHP